MRYLYAGVATTQAFSWAQLFDEVLRGSREELSGVKIGNGLGEGFGGVAVVVFEGFVGAGGEEEFDEFAAVVAVEDCAEERGVAVGVLSVDVGAVV